MLQLKRACWMLLIPLLCVLYVPLDHNNGNVHSLVTPLDQLIPFCKYFVVPYLAWYGLIFVALVWFLRRNYQVYLYSIGAILLGLAVSYIVFAVFQTTVPRPEISGHDIFSRLTELLYYLDNPYNAFPSIHVLTSWIILSGSRKLKDESPRLAWFFQVETVAVVLATLLLKQHTLFDVAGGTVLGILSIKLVQKYIAVREAKLARRATETGKLHNAVPQTQR